MKKSFLVVSILFISLIGLGLATPQKSEACWFSYSGGSFAYSYGNDYYPTNSFSSNNYSSYKTVYRYYGNNDSSSYSNSYRTRR